MSKYIEMNIPAPRMQGVVVLAATLVVMLGGAAMAKNPLFSWMTSGAFLLLFIVFNAAASIFSDHFPKYVQESLVVLVCLLLATGLVSTLVSGFTIHKAEPYRTIYIILILAYFSLTALCLLIRGAVDFLMSKDNK